MNSFFENRPDILQDMDAHAHQREVQLRSTCGTPYIECTTIKARVTNKLLLTFGSYNIYCQTDTLCDFDELFLMDSIKFSCFIPCKV